MIYIIYDIFFDFIQFPKSQLQFLCHMSTSEIKVTMTQRVFFLFDIQGHPSVTHRIDLRFQLIQVLPLTPNSSNSLHGYPKWRFV